MKTIISSIFIFLTSTLTIAQVSTPKASPNCKIEQTVGLTHFEINFSRPSKNNRIIFGKLVPYNKIWRTGANENTTIHFDDDVIFDLDTLRKGTYAIYTKPMKETWEVYFYNDTDNWGTPETWDESKVAARILTPVMKNNLSVESFTINFNNITSNAAELTFAWDKVFVKVPFKVNTDQKVEASIQKTLNGPSKRDYYNAANYYLSEKKDLNKALEWMKIAVEKDGGKSYWMTRKLALIYADLKDYEEAIKTAQISLDAATQSGNKHYMDMNRKSIEEWKKLKK